MVGSSFKLFAYFLSLSLFANPALARASNVTFSEDPTACSPVTISWRGGVAPFTVIVLQVDPLEPPRTDGTTPGVVIQTAAAGSARRVVWTAVVQPGKTLVAVVRDGQEQNASSQKSVVQASRDVACLAAVPSTDNATPTTLSLPTLMTTALSNGTSTILFGPLSTVRPSEAPLIPNQKRSNAFPVLLTVFTVGIVVGLAIYGLCIYRNGAPKRSDRRRYSDIERGDNGGDMPNISLQMWVAYGKQQGQDITRKISALVSRRPTAVVASEKPDSFTILPEDSPPAPREGPQLSPESRADDVQPRSIIAVPIMPVQAMSTSRPTSSATFSPTRETTETGTGLSPPSRPTSTNQKGLRPARSRSNIRSQGKPLPIPPALQLDRQGTQRQYGLPRADNRLEAMRPRSASKIAKVTESNHKRASSLPSNRQSAGAAVVAAWNSPPVHLAQVPISALPPATPTMPAAYRHSRASVRSGRGGTQGASGRKRSNTIGSVVVGQEVPFVMASTPTPRSSQTVRTSRAGPRTSLPTDQPLENRNMPEPLDFPSSPSGSDEESQIDPLNDLPHNRLQ